MATFIATIQFTEQGIKDIRDTTKRASAIKTAAKKMGIKVTSVYWTLGAFDGVLIFDAPDDETATALMLHIASLGNVKTRTARAFDATAMEKILGSME